MKSILALVVMAVLSTANAFATQITATFGDQDSSNNYRIQADSSGLVTFANDTSIAYPYENISSPTSKSYTLTAADSGSYILDWGQLAASHANTGSTTSGNAYTLPLCTSTSLGKKFEVITAVKETITVTPTSTADTIAYSISGTPLSAGVGVKTSNTAGVGDKIGMVCASSGTWVVTGCSGCATAP